MRNFAAPLLFCLFFALFIASCKRMGKKEEAPASDKVFTVGSARIQTSEILDLIKIKGVFAPTQRVQIKSEFTGRIQELSVIDGQSIAKGGALLKFEEEELPSVLESQRAALKVAEDQQALETRWAEVGAPEELGEEVEELEEAQAVVASRLLTPIERSPPWIPPSGYWVPVPGLPKDAGGVWPKMEVVRDDAAISQDPEDAGGIWPDYGPRKRVIGDEYFSVVERGYPGDRMSSLAGVNRSIARPLTVTQALAPAEQIQVMESRLSLEPSAKVTENLLSLGQAKVDRIKAEMAITEGQLAERSLSSPIDGFVEKVAVKEDGLVTAGDLLVEIIRVDPIDLILKAPKNRVDKLEVGLEVTVSLSGEAGPSLNGEISFIGAELDADKKSIEVRVRMANPDFKIKVGMEGLAEIAVVQK